MHLTIQQRPACHRKVFSSNLNLSQLLNPMSDNSSNYWDVWGNKIKAKCEEGSVAGFTGSGKTKNLPTGIARFLVS